MADTAGVDGHRTDLVEPTAEKNVQGIAVTEKLAGKWVVETRRQKPC